MKCSIGAAGSDTFGVTLATDLRNLNGSVLTLPVHLTWPSMLDAGLGRVSPAALTNLIDDLPS
jgi:hypothetical protein